MNTATSSVYPSKVDIWLALLALASPLLVIAIGVYLIVASPTAGGAMMILFGILGIVIMAVMTIPCRYTLTDRSLIIHCGLCTYEEIKIEEIRDAIPTNNPFSAPALSLKRVKIVLDNGYRLISPVDRERFIREICEKLEAAGKPGAA